jgi:phage shock protein PspC (stress-responsive transcriptional regulator)
MDNRIPCPYCAEDIRPEAVRCPHCRSRLGGLDPTAWYRDHPERRLAGVSTAVAHGLGVSLPAVRVGFIALSFFHLLGPVLYGLLWLVIPSRPGERPPYEHGVARARDIAGRFARGSGSGVMPEEPRA